MAVYRGRSTETLGIDLMPHLVLLGDSIFDNAAYTGGGPDVVSQVRKILPTGWTASPLAIDGSRTGDVCRTG
jgi:hypothetical protein